MGVAALWVPFAVLGQIDRGTITGTVLDPAGAVVPGATIAARNTESGSRFETVTTTTGNYTLAQVPAGMYELSVEMAGFNRFVQQGIRIYVAQTARIDVTLEVGATTQSVMVTADAPLLKTESAEQSTTIAREKLNELPLNFGARGNVAAASIRNPYTFVTLVPGGNISNYSSIKLNGAPLDTFQIRVEGQEANNNRLMIRQDQVQPSVEALEEVSVQTSNFAPEYGQVAGGLFNLTAKSGTNQIHGSVFEYFVNEAFGAGLPFTDNRQGELVRPRNRRHDYGGSVGGPVVIPKLYDGHNRTFFFFSLERFYQKENVSGRLATVPTDAMRRGDFSEALTGRNLGTDPLGRPITENAIYDPLSTRNVNGFVVRDPFPGNQVPLTQLDPVALKIQNFIPRPTRTGIINNWDQSYEALTNKNIASIKADHNFTNQGKVSFYYSRYWGPHFNGSDGLPVPITATRRIPTSTHTFRLNYNRSITPTLLMTAGIGYMRHYNPDLGLPEVREFDALAGLGLRGALGKGFPVITGLNSATGGGLSISPLARTGSIPATNKPSAVLSATYVRDSHTYKAGGEWRVDSLTSRNLGSSTGDYAFSVIQSGLPSTQVQPLVGGNVGLPYASFLMGMANSAVISNPNDPQARKTVFAFFAQDNWKVNRRLTLDYGLRWDHQGYPNEFHNRTSAFAPNVPNPAAGNLLGATAYEGNGPGRCNCNFAGTYPYAFGPRLGAAFQITPKTVLRGGWGITYGATTGSQSTPGTTLGAGGWNTINFSTPAFGEPAAVLRNGLSYSLADLYRETFNPMAAGRRA
jgi:Carboxypeptidase regulatory-like domain/TonB dependent receptor